MIRWIIDEIRQLTGISENMQKYIRTHGAVVPVIQFYFEPIPEGGMLLKISGQKNCEIKEYNL